MTKNYINQRNGQEEVPLLADNHNNTNRRASVTSTRTSESRRSGSAKLMGNHVTDFDHTDSWGMLHESDTDYDLERAGRIAKSNTFIDHRPTLSSKNNVNDSSTNITNTHNHTSKNNSTGYMATTPLVKKKARAYSVSSAKYSKDSHGTGLSRRGTTSKIGSLTHSKTQGVNDDVVIDVDALLQDVRKNRKRDHPSSFSSESDEDVGSDEEDEYNSRPSSRGSSSNSSLDDVCLVLDDESDKARKIWPDISILEEYSKEETARLRRQAIEDAEAFHYRYDTEDDDVFNSSLQDIRDGDNNDETNGVVSPVMSNRERILFSKPIVTNIDVPELGNKQVNEAALLRSGRLRPKKIAPWHLMQRQGSTTTPQNKDIIGGDARAKMEDKQMRDNFLVGRNIQYPPHIISNNPEHFKFTYFRIDLDSTVHSPTISGLLQPGQTFEDLFVRSVYGNPKNNTNNGNNTTANSIAPQQKDVTQQPIPMNTNGPKRVPSSIKFQSVSPLDTSAAGTVTGVPTALGHTSNNNNNNNGSILQSMNNNGNSLYRNVSGVSTVDEDVAPFWLDVSSPTEEEMKVISKTFGIHPLTTEDIFLGEVREKVELFKDYYLICFRSFDIVAEKHTRRQKEKNGIDSNGNPTNGSESGNRGGVLNILKKLWSGNKTNQGEAVKLLKRRASTMSYSSGHNGGNTDNGNNNTVSLKSGSIRNRRKSIIKKRQERERFKRKSGDRHKPRAGELEPLNVYIIVFRTGVLTFHFAPTPHPINVRRRARLLRDYLDVTADWIAYAIIDDITDAFGPMIELIEDEVYDIEDAILKMNHNDSDSDSDSDPSSSSDDSSDSTSDDSSEHGRLLHKSSRSRNSEGIRIPRSVHSGRSGMFTGRRSSYSNSGSSGIMTRSSMNTSSSSSSDSSSDASTFNANLIGWKKKGDMLRRIGDCRKRVMSILRLLGAKADVIKGFAKRYNGQWDTAAQAEIGMYLDDIQDHIITMVSSLNHYEKLLSRSHSNYLAQINIDMTKVNNDMNDVLGKITILGTIVLPMNVITGLWGMNVIVPGQKEDSLRWFTSIVGSMVILAYIAYIYTKRKFGF
ncbi:CorA metal ion transporter [Maudiozyma exigua]|uniref:CorA metal ion transporter n=1 Tax=Maudiozyma exigua TaxID=34358 RepID=A0A9P7BBF7_MAUEX|nr:CorA metal ion transporter [Kazachstania exigua]